MGIRQAALWICVGLGGCSSAIEPKPTASWVDRQDAAPVVEANPAPAPVDKWFWLRLLNYKKTSKSEAREAAFAALDAGHLIPAGVELPYWAIADNELELVERLVAAGARCNDYALVTAPTMEMFELLETAGADYVGYLELTKTNPFGAFPRLDNARLVSRLAPDHLVAGESLAYWAVRADKPDAVRRLLDRGANLDAQVGKLALIHEAVLYERHKTLPVLIAHGVDLDELSPGGLSALDIAVQQQNKRAAAILRDSGATRNPDARIRVPRLATAAENKLIRRAVTSKRTWPKKQSVPMGGWGAIGWSDRGLVAIAHVWDYELAAPDQPPDIHPGGADPMRGYVLSEGGPLEDATESVFELTIFDTKQNLIVATYTGGFRKALNRWGIRPASAASRELRSGKDIRTAAIWKGRLASRSVEHDLETTVELHHERAGNNQLVFRRTVLSIYNETCELRGHFVGDTGGHALAVIECKNEYDIRSWIPVGIGLL